MLAVLSFFIYVWPTQFRYDHTNIQGRRLPVRINRFSGETKVLTEDGWVYPQSLKSKEQTVPTLRELDLGVLFKIEGRAGINSNASIGRATFNASLYNGSDWEINELTVELGIKGFKRKFRLIGSIEPLSSANLIADMDYETMTKWSDNGMKNPDWNIVSGKGFPPPGYKPHSLH